MAVSKSIIEEELSRKTEEISIIRLVDAIIINAYDSRASDIHFDPAEEMLNIRYRIDGVLHYALTIPKEIHPEVISRIKVLSDLRTDEHRAAQDGRIQFAIKQDEGTLSFDIRVSIMPTYHGENAVLRLLVEQGETFNIEDIGFSKRDFAIISKALNESFGMILITGPTGSGKTTTLYTMLQKLNTPDVSIITIEDPIEYSIKAVNQIQVDSKTGITFADGLRSILRQDPNIIMVGEIRDEETAGIAVNAALTGHLLFSTIHTNDSSTTLPRLLDMNVEPFLIASTVNVAIGQRLVRKICQDCRKEKVFSLAEVESLRKSLPEEVIIDGKTFYYGEGCNRCDNSGYKGRTGIYEVLDITHAIRSAITGRKSATDIKEIAIKEGMTTMLQDGIIKAEAGLTSIQEVLRVMHG